MEQYILGGAAKPSNGPPENAVRISAPEIVSDIKSAMENGAKKFCFEKGNPNACISLSDYYREVKKFPDAAKVIIDCCQRLKNPICCWESCKIFWLIKLAFPPSLLTTWQ